MTCPEELELFQLREGGLSEEREEEVAAHVSGCAECQATLAELEGLGQALAAPEPLAEGEKQAFVAGVLSKLEEREGAAAQGATPRRWFFTAPVVAAACCAALALAVLPMAFLAGGRDEAPTAGAVAQTMAESAPVGGEGWGDDDGEASSQRFGIRGPADRGLVATAEEPAPRLARGDSSREQSRRARMPAAPAEVASADFEADEAEGARMSGLSKALRPAPPAPSVVVDGRQAASAPSRVALDPSDQSIALGLPGYHGRGAGGSAAFRTTVAPRASAIDPNGRFATTYRPGRGHLARFEATMLKGRAPEAALALVSEVGHGAGALVQHPTEEALGLHVSTEMGQLPPAGGPVHLAITLRSTPQRPTGRPEIAVHLVMDTSGSMSGAAIEQARAAAAQLVGLLQPADRFSLVSYNSDASIVVSEGPVGSRQASILSQVAGIRAGGGTNLEAGLRMGYDQAQRSRQARDSAVQLVIVLSDGRANQGITDPHALSEMAAAAFQSGFETTTIGVGDDYDPMVMSTLADYGAGGYYYLPDASTIEQVLRAELEVRSQPVARGVELRVRLGDGIELLQAYGSRRLSQLEASRVRAAEVAIDHQAAHRDGISRDRQEDREGGMRFFIPGFARDDQHTILLRLRVPAGSAGAGLVLADLELRYKDRILNRNGGAEQRVQRPYAATQQVAMASQDRNVRRMVLTFRTGDALNQVSSLIASGRQPQALALLHERSALLNSTANELDDPALRAEAARLDSFRSMIATQGIQNRLMLGALVQRASSAMMR